MTTSRHTPASPARPPRGRLSPAAWIVLLVLAVAPTVAPEPATAQTVDSRDMDMGAIQRKIELIYPRSGPPGTLVRVNTEDMPVITPIRVGIGAAQAGFEAFQELMTGQEGEFDVSVAVPEWASWDRVHLFIVFDIYFRPIALSDAFHVTNDEGLIRRTGRVTHQDDGCSILRDIDGVQYALLGEGDTVEGIEANTTVTVDGRVLPREMCGLSNVLEVTTLRAD
jgi:hypothetical protein